MDVVKMTELTCPSCGGKLEVDRQNPNIEECLECHTRYAMQWIV